MKHKVNYFTDKITDNCTWREFLLLRKENLIAIPDNALYLENALYLADTLESIRARFNKPLIFTSVFRPKYYNAYIKGGSRSKHMELLAADFIVGGRSSESVREYLEPRVEEFNIQLELNQTVHVHIACCRDKYTPKSFFV